jgi:hypothetical protein
MRNTRIMIMCRNLSKQPDGKSMMFTVNPKSHRLETVLLFHLNDKLFCTCIHSSLYITIHVRVQPIFG